MTVMSRRAFLRGRLSVADQEHDVPRVALVHAQACLGSALQVCTSCVERCGARRALRMQGLTPVVDADCCTGCGECVEVCPAPVPALRLVPKLMPKGAAP
jgi:Na+-translocating ferredoxin:NAD+ oxidoreductase RNF subunit RnfB